MKKNKLLNRFLLMLTIPALLLGCSEDEPNATSGSSFQFESIASSYYEEDGEVSISIAFRNASGSVTESDLVIDGTATEGEDYEIVSVSADGIEITISDDATPEFIETIRFSIPGAGGNSTHTVRLSSDDPGYLDIDLDWASAADDMDLHLFYYDTTVQQFVHLSASDPGHLSIDFTDDDGEYGVSYNYYDGTSDPLAFTATFTPTGVTVDGGSDPAVFDGTYTLDNIDPDAQQIEQTFVKTGTDFADFSDIEEPAVGSRKSELRMKLREAVAKYKAEHSK